ncbi:MAG: hypothetical protein AAGI63_03110, partial [Planctomycetota bacterium]
MSSDDFLLESVERSQRDKTRRRRSERSKRRQLYALTGLFLILALVLCLPSLISHSSMGRSMLVRTLEEQGLTADVDAMRIGWITPLRVTGLHVHGDAGTELVVDQLDMDLTVPDLMRNLTHFGEVTLRGVALVGRVGNETSSLEQDLQTLLASSGEGESATAAIKIQDLTVTVTDEVTGGTWQITQSSAEVQTTPIEIQATFAGVVTEPSGGGGSLQGEFRFPLSTPNVSEAPDESSWSMQLQSESLPLSVMSLVRRRFPTDAAAIPYSLSGDATGSVSIAGSFDRGTQADIRHLQIRNLHASDQNARVWSNALATVDGQLVVLNHRVIGKQLQARTDFGSATIDGAFSRTFSLVGANDNPLQWLEAIDGIATAEIDLAAMDRALPGLLPLRNDAQIISGRVFARLDSANESQQRRSQLSFRSEALRGRAQGRGVIIDPIELTATVSNRAGVLTADEFRWTSAFGTALGQGNAESGNVNFDIDFGRLSAMLKPIVAFADTSLSGQGLSGKAQGNLAWNSSINGIWRLSGNADASELLITTTSGQTLRRPSLRGRVSAVGRWGNQSLEELSQATIALNSDGMELSAELVEPVTKPGRNIAMPLRLLGSGRLETIQQTFGPWLPTELQESGGNFTLSASVDCSPEFARLYAAAVELTHPRVAYGGREFTQPNVKILFDGEYLWPSGTFESRSLTVAGDAFSAAAKGTYAAGNIDLDVKWRAKLERIQGSVGERISTRDRAAVQQVAYRAGVPPKTNDWLMMGDCEGSIRLSSRAQFIDIDLQTDGTGVAIVQPPEASEQYQTVGPLRRGSAGRPNSGRARVVWSEPELTLDGRLSYDTSTGEIISEAMQVAGNWFATTLSGNA